MPEITIKMDGADAVRHRLNEISGRISNMSPIMKAIGDRIVRQTFERFNAGGPAPDGTPWAPPKTSNQKRRGTLRVSDQLRDSIRPQMIGNNTVAIGTNKVYAAIHQLGSRPAAHDILPRSKKALKTPYGLFRRVHHPGSVIPARPFLGLSQANSDKIISIINDYITGRK